MMTDHASQQRLGEVIAEVDRLRATLGPRADRHRPEALDRLADLLDASPALNHEPIVQALIADLRNFGVAPRLPTTKKHINAPGSSTIFSLFDASYFPSLSLEWVEYEELPADPHLVARYASPTRPVLTKQSSQGFADRVVVALFPENHIDGVQEPDDSVFYFIDKFVERHVRLTRRLVGAMMADDAFPLVRVATEAEVTTASSWWVRLHEYHHRTGCLPIPQYLPMKSFKPLAGLEELRTDVASMLACHRDAELPPREASMTFEYILSERLLRYAVEGIPRPNYDAVASQLFFNYLKQAGAIELRDGKIVLDPQLPDALGEFASTVDSIEKHILTEPQAQVKQRLLDFTNQYTDFDQQTGDYRHIPFFADVKQLLGV